MMRLIPLFFLLLPMSSWASIYSSPAKLALPPASADRFEKLQYVLKGLGLPEEESALTKYEIPLFDQAQTKDRFEKLLQFIDPNQNLNHYATWDENELQVFQDRDTKKVLDFAVRFNKNNSNGQYDPHRLSEIKGKSLKGLRIALDPGHMGAEKCGSGWDIITGKYVSTAGRCLSEGEMAREVALLLADSLEQLGADVLLTRDSADPVTDLKMETFPLQDSIADELYQDSDTPWFDSLLSQYKKTPDLQKAFLNNFEIHRIKNGSLREYFYIFHEDLAARAKMINEFKPDLTLVLHFDASSHNVLQNHANAIRSFVEGNIKGQEITSREQRASVIRALLDNKRYTESIEFSRKVTSSLSKTLNIPVKSDPIDYGGIRIEDGIYARNLALTRQITQGLLTYLELLYYDYEPENQKLWKKDQQSQLRVNGKNYQLIHSTRIREIAAGLKQGILNYVQLEK